MATKKKKKGSSMTGTVIAMIVAAVVAFLLFHPEWLPLPEATKAMIRDLIQSNFLIERSGHITAAHLLTLLLAICVMWLIYTVLKLILNATAEKSARARTVARLTVQALKYLAVIVGVIWGLRILGVNATAVLAGVGIIGLILGFGAQSLIEDIITGLFIIFEGQYSIGDIIVLDDFRGIVRDIGVRTTTIEGKNLKVVNNSDIRNFQNRSRKLSLAICECSVAYETDIPKLEKMLAETLPFMKHDLYESAPRYLGVQELGDSGVLLKFVADVKEENIFAAQRQLNRDIRVLFAERGVEIPFPQVVVHNGD